MTERSDMTERRVRHSRQLPLRTFCCGSRAVLNDVCSTPAEPPISTVRPTSRHPRPDGTDTLRLATVQRNVAAGQ